MPRMLLFIYSAAVSLALLVAFICAIRAEAASLWAPLAFGLGFFGRATWIEARRLRADRHPASPNTHVRSRADIT